MHDIRAPGSCDTFPASRFSRQSMHSWLRGYFVAPVRATTNTVRLRNYFRNSVRAATNTFRLRDHFRPSSPRRDKYIPPPQLFPSLQSAPRQIQSASATISAIQSASRQIQSASATISVTPVCAATNTVRLRNYFRNSVRVATNTVRLRNYFRHSSLRRDKYVPPPRPFPPLQSASRQIQSASATISAIQSAPRQIRSASATISAIQSAPRQIRSASATISAIQPINLVVVPKLYNTNYTLFSQIYFPTNTSPAPPSSITTLPHPFLHHYPLSDYFHPNLHSISFTRHAIFSPPPRT